MLHLLAAYGMLASKQFVLILGINRFHSLLWLPNGNVMNVHARMRNVQLNGETTTTQVVTYTHMVVIIIAKSTKSNVKI